MQPAPFWRHRKVTDTLDDMERGHGRRPGSQRCGVLGLEHGDCDQECRRDKIYCYYHLKMSQGLVTDFAPLYPVFPLPLGGYILTATPPKPTPLEAAA